MPQDIVLSYVQCNKNVEIKWMCCEYHTMPMHCTYGDQARRCRRDGLPFTNAASNPTIFWWANCKQMSPESASCEASTDWPQPPFPSSPYPIHWWGPNVCTFGLVASTRYVSSSVCRLAYLSIWFSWSWNLKQSFYCHAKKTALLACVTVELHVPAILALGCLVGDSPVLV